MAFTDDTRAMLNPKLFGLVSASAAGAAKFILEDVIRLSGGGHEEGSDLQTPAWLPERFADRYDQRFLERLMVCALVVGHKIESSADSSLACVAEEIAFHMVLEIARDYAQTDGWTAEEMAVLEEYEEDVLEDSDFAILYGDDPEVEATPLPDSHGESDYYANLRFEDWFVPFRDDEPVHPFCREE